MTIFKWGEFTSNAGLTLPFKIDLDSLDDADWDCLARIIAREFAFSEVEGVPTGGLRLAEALKPYRTKAVVFQRPFDVLLIVDDVLTTGGSMERHRAGRDALGVVVFARGCSVPDWIKPIFTLSDEWETSYPCP